MSLLGGIPAAVAAVPGLPTLAAELPSPTLGVWHLGPLARRGRSFPGEPSHPARSGRTVADARA